MGIKVSQWEYNIIANEFVAFERALLCLLDERGGDELTIGNVYIYGAADNHIGAWFVDEHGERLKDLDYTLAWNQEIQ